MPTIFKRKETKTHFLTLKRKSLETNLFISLFIYLLYGIIKKNL